MTTLLDTRTTHCFLSSTECNSRNVARWGTAVLFATLISGCGQPSYPDEQAVRERFQVEYRDAKCELVTVHSPEPQPDQPSQPFLYVHIPFEARCLDLTGKSAPLLRTQVWKRDRERPALAQGAWGWTQAGEI